ncbi:MAG: hypothetical protein AAFQ07_08180 [Chloroflexota bacterium]
MVDKKPNIIERLVVTCFSSGLVLGGLVGVVSNVVSLLDAVGILPFRLVAGIIGASLCLLLALYWALPLLLLILLVDYRQRPQLFIVASAGLIIVQSIAILQFLPLILPGNIKPLWYFVQIVSPIAVAIGALHQYIRQQEDLRKEKPKRKLTTTHPLALEDEGSQPEVYEATVREQESRSI